MLTLYGVHLSPFARKAFIGLEEKGLKYDHVMTMPGDASPEFRAISPVGKVPALTDGEFSISDSTAILNYLDAIAPTPPLYPASPQAKARAVWFEEYADTILNKPTGALFFNRIAGPRYFDRPGNEEAIREAVEESGPACFDYLDGQLKGADFFVRDKFSVADLSVVSMLISMRSADFEPDPSRWPNLARWFKKTLARKSVRAAVEQMDAMLKAA